MEEGSGRARKRTTLSTTERGQSRMTRFSLGKKLVGGGLVLLILPLLGLGAFSLIWSSAAMEKMAGEQLETMRGVVIEQVNQILKEQTDLLRNFTARNALIQELLQVAKASESYQLVNFKLNRSTTIYHDKNLYEFLLITDKNGAVVGDTLNGALKGNDLSSEEHVTRALGLETAIGQVRRAEKTQDPYLVMASPLLYQGELMGAAVVGWRVSPVSDKVRRIRIGERGHVVVADRAGRILAHPDKARFMGATLEKTPGMESVARDMVALGSGTVQVPGADGERIVSFGPIAQSDWSLALVQPLAEIQAPVIRMRNILAASVLAAALVVGIVLALTVHREINRPIHGIVKRLGQGAAGAGAASTQLSSASQTLAEQSAAQAAALQETSSSLEEMSAMTRQNADHARQADLLMQAANTAVEKAGASMQSLTDSMTEIDTASAEISRIIKTIDEISFQTNLLALNAAVEAARAGQAGAGFAVVADEVRALALRAAEAAHSTAGLIDGTVKKIRQGSATVTATAQEFTEVASKSATVGRLLREISAASGEQAQGIEQLNRAVADMDRTVQQNAAGAEQSAGASNEMMLQSQNVQEIVRELVALVGMERKLPAADSRRAGCERPRASAGPRPDLRENAWR
jgi:methyl-accepting chemotaxis protein